MPRSFLIFSQSDYLIQLDDINSHTSWQTVQIQISWLLKKPTDLDLHCLQRQDISGFSRTRVKGPIFLKNRHFLFKRLNCQISDSLSFVNWIKNEMIFYLISELMLAALIQWYDKKSFHFKNKRLTEILQAVRCRILRLYSYHISIY